MAGVEAIGASLALSGFADGSLSREEIHRIQDVGLSILMSPVLLPRLMSAPVLTVGSHPETLCIAVCKPAALCVPGLMHIFVSRRRRQSSYRAKPCLAVPLAS